MYISGPISLGDQFRNVQVAIDAFNDLMDAGIFSYCPHTTCFMNMTRQRSHKEWLRYDVLAMLPRCNAVWRLPGESVGADEECREARRLGIPVFDQFSDVVHWHQAQEQEKPITTEGAI